MSNIQTPKEDIILRKLVLDRYKMSKRAMTSKDTVWKEVERQYQAYIKLSDYDRLRKEQKIKQDGYVPIVPIVIPVGYAAIQTILTYLTGIFLSRYPLYEIYGTRRDSRLAQSGVDMEALLEHQARVKQFRMYYHTFLLDSLKYGFGVLHEDWVVDSGMQLMRVPTPLGLVEMEDWVTSYEGNSVMAIDPRRYFPDPRVPLPEVQKGEFVIIEQDLSRSAIVEGFYGGRFENIGAIPKVRPKGDEYPLSDRNLKYGITVGDLVDEKDTGFVNLKVGYIKLIPKIYGLGDSTYPEIWNIVLANDTAIIRKKRYAYNHGGFPFGVAEPEGDGHSFLSQSYMELITPLQHITTFLFNSHMENVRKTVNDEIVFDPSRLEISDVMDPKPGKRIRVKPAGYGQDVRSMFAQFSSVDVTQAHLRDMSFVWDIIQRITAATDNVMGMLDDASRRSATESRQAQQSAVGRLQKLAELISIQAIQPHAMRLIQNTQQFLSEERVYKILGTNDGAQSLVKIAPEDIQGQYFLAPFDGAIVSDKYAQAQVWKELLLGVGQSEALSQRIDLFGLFKHTARLLGAKNIADFEIQTAPDQQVLDEQQKGNVIPLQEALANGLAGGRA